MKISKEKLKQIITEELKKQVTLLLIGETAKRAPDARKPRLTEADEYRFGDDPDTERFRGTPFYDDAVRTSARRDAMKSVSKAGVTSVRMLRIIRAAQKKVKNMKNKMGKPLPLHKRIVTSKDLEDLLSILIDGDLH